MTCPSAPPLAALIAELRRLHEEATRDDRGTGTPLHDYVAALCDAGPRLLSAAERAEGMASALERLMGCVSGLGRHPVRDLTEAMEEARSALAAYRGSAGGGTDR